MRFFVENGQRVATIEMPPAEPRRIGSRRPDCVSLADATVALLSVLLDERAKRPHRRRLATLAPPPPHPRHPSSPHPSSAPTPRVLYSSGIVAPDAAGSPPASRSGPLAGAPPSARRRDLAVTRFSLAAGDVTVGASTLALSACAGPRSPKRHHPRGLPSRPRRLLQPLRSAAFPTFTPRRARSSAARPTSAPRCPIAGGFGRILRGGVWVPLTRLDVTVRGASSGFATTSVGPKAGLGVEMNFRACRVMRTPAPSH